MKKLIPKKYEFSYDYSFYLHDLLVQLIKESEAERIFDVEFTFKNSDEAQSFNKQSLEGEELWQWLYKNNYYQVIQELSRKQVFVAVLTDFCQFLYESLKCSNKGRLAIAYSLLRKPLKENLFILEWLLANPEDFSKKFHDHNLNDLDISKIPSQQKVKIISSSLDKSINKNWVDAQFIYDLRYSKNSFFGYEAVWNKAVHLVTTFKDYKTEPENLNFVFSNDKVIMDDLWRHYFRALPLLLNHTIEVTFSFIKNIIDLDIVSDYIFEAKRRIGMVLWSKEFFKEDDNSELFNSAKEILKSLELQCPLCKKRISIDKKNLYNFYYSSGIICKGCKTYVQLNL